jgi:hypothetical protein
MADDSSGYIAEGVYNDDPDEEYIAPILESMAKHPDKAVHEVWTWGKVKFQIRKLVKKDEKKS